VSPESFHATIRQSLPAERGVTTSLSRANGTDLRDRFEREATPLLGTLHRVARQLTTNVVDAEDLVQDTLLKAYIGFQTFQPGTHMRAWLMKIMRNVWIDDHRRSRRRPVEWLSEDVSDRNLNAYYRHTHHPDSVEERLIGVPFTAEISEAISELPQSMGRALYYAYVEGFAYKDIARMECIPVGTVMSRLYRARLALRSALAASMPESFFTEYERLG
jgi:RNA polymerase sigma-70 factor, ECF subfamily